MIDTILAASAKLPTPSKFMPTFNNGIFAQQLATKENSISSIIAAASAAGQKGGKIAATSMKDIREHPCESSPAPGCVSP